jgi:predicted ATPase
LHPFPFNIPVVRLARDVLPDRPTTIFVGDNGCGKSTLPESIGYSVDLPLIGIFLLDEPEAALSPSRTIRKVIAGI